MARVEDEFGRGGVAQAANEEPYMKSFGRACKCENQWEEGYC